MASKRVTGFWGWRHLVHLWRSSLFWDTKKYSKCSKNDSKGAKVKPKCFKSDPQGRKIDSYRSAKVVQVHQKMSAARYQAQIGESLEVMPLRAVWRLIPFLNTRGVPKVFPKVP